jgi:NTP pyrophosphatase (non-canonical NTP hydrolase)
MKLKDFEYYRTLDGLLSRIYSHQRYNSRHKRNHPYPEYSKVELKAWILAQPTFSIIWDTWVKSDYNKDLTPSVDRVNKDIHYTIDNIQLLTWEANNSKGRQERTDGNMVEQYHLDGGFVDSYKSYYDASKQTGIPSANIQKVCIGERATAGKYLWRHSEDHLTEFDKVRKWARSRNLTSEGDAKTQTLKICEELGELARSILKKDGKELCDAIGDTLVTIVVLADILDLRAEDCWLEAIDIIKERSGKMINGTFIKSEDLQQLTLDFGEVL